MNKVHRIVWSASKECFVVSHERSRSFGKPSSTRKNIIRALAGVCLALEAGVALAACAVSVNTSTTGPCEIDSSGLSVTGSGSISSSGSSGQWGTAAITSGTVNGDITNAGTIQNTYSEGRGVHIYDSATLNGKISNSGTISANGHGVEIGNTTPGTISAGADGIAITNSGTISSTSASWGDESGIRLANQAVVTGNIVNSGTISGYWRGLNIAGATLTGDVSNTATGILTNSSGSTSHTGAGLWVGADGVVAGLLDGKVTNQGTISGSSYGVYVGANGSITGGLVSSGSISGGSGTAIQITNTGTISGANTQGAIQISAGTITGSIANAGTISNSADNARGIHLYGGAALTGKIDNSGTISASGHGIEIGNTTAATITAGSDGYALVNSGTIQANNASIFADESGIRIANSSVVTGKISNSGTVSGAVNGININSATLAGDLANIGTISGATTGVLISSGSTVSGTLTNSGTITGGSYAIRDLSNSLGAITITGADTAHFNGAVVASAANLSVASGASYTFDNGGQFTVAGFTNNGTLKMGDGYTATITGNFTNVGTYRTTVSSAASFGKLVVSGTANLGGSLFVDVAGSNTLASGNTLLHVIHANSVTGTFASVTDNSSLFNFTANYTSNDVNLNVVSASFNGAYAATAATNTQVAHNAAHVLDQIFVSNPTGSISSTFYGITGGSQAISNAVAQTLPLLTGGTTSATQEALGSINRIVQARIETNRGLSSGDSFLGDRNFWLKPFGSWANQEERNGIAGFKANTAGVVGGFDAALSPVLRLGGALAYARSDINGKSAIAPQSADVDMFQLIGYGSYSLDDRTEVNFQADAGQNNNKGRRQLGFASAVATSDYHSQTAHVGAGIGRSYGLSERTSVTPSLRMDYTWIKDKAYSETGAGALNLNVGSRTTEALVVGADAKLTHQLNDQTVLLTNLGVGYDTINKRAAILASYAGAADASFVTYGIDPSPWLVRGGLGATYKIKENLELTGRYDMEYREKLLSQTASAKLRWSF